MKSKTLFFNKGILINDLKRFSWMGIIYLLLLFFAVPLKILMEYGSMMRYQREIVIDNYHPIRRIFGFGEGIQTLIMLAVPVLIGVFLFRYIQSKRSVDMLHSLPIRREEFLNTYVLIGIIFLTIPVILTAFFALALNITLQLGSYYTFLDLLRWAGISILMNITIFLACVFVGMHTGLSTIQAGLTYIFLLLPTGVLVLFNHNLGIWIHGFTEGLLAEKYVVSLSPIVRMMSFSRVYARVYDRNSNLLSTWEFVGYSIACIVFYLLARWSYKKRHLEAASQSIAFPNMRPIFKYGVTFCMMLLGGIYFWETQRTIAWTIFGYFAASLLGYFIAEILLRKSLKVLGSIKGYLIYGAVMICLLLGIQMDLTGYEKYSPNLSEVKSIVFGPEVYSDHSIKAIDQHNLHKEIYIDPYLITQNNAYFEKENLENIQAFHQRLIKNKNVAEGRESDTRNIYFYYKLKNGKTVKRKYDISYKEYEEYFKPIYESKEYKNLNYPILNLKTSYIDKLTIYPDERVFGKQVSIIDPNEIQEVIEILKQDIYDQSYEEITDTRAPWATIQLSIKGLNPMDYELINPSTSWNKSYVKLEQWLAEKDYIKNARILPDEVEYVIVEKIEGDSQYRYKKYIDEMDKSVKKLEIRDKGQIEVCLRNYSYGYNEEVRYIVGFYEKSKNNIMYASFDEKLAPDFVKEYFK